MFILQLLSNPAIAIVTIAAIIMAITVHEWAHAWTAVRLGDDTPRLMGRVTLDPSAHIDPMGGLLFLLIGFGWGKPVIYNPLRLRRKVDELLIALAGPFVNLITALLVNGIRIGLTAAFSSNTSANWQAFLGYLMIVSYYNVVLAAFNFLPFPPLDGSSIIAHFYRPWRSWAASQVGFVILLILIFPTFGGTNLLSLILDPIIHLFQIITLTPII